MRLECPIHGIVPCEETVRGYETAKNEYVRFEPDELKALEQALSSALVIDSFVPEGAVDSVYFEDTYYLGAGKNGERATGCWSKRSGKLTEPRSACSRGAARRLR
jgi:DNA end-binding protein Ku